MNDGQKQTLRDAFARASAAHIAVDMQKFYCRPKIVKQKCDKFGRTELIAPLLAAPGLVARFSEKSRPLMTQGWVAQPMFEEGGAQAAYAKGAVLRKMVKDSLYRQPAKKDDIFSSKSGADAFHESGLDDVLRARGIDTIILSGVFMDICVTFTALGARERGFAVIIAEDLTVASSAEGRKAAQRMLDDAGVLSAKAAEILAIADGMKP